MIEFSCHTWAFNDLTLTEALGTIARLGFRYADLGSGAHLNPVKAVADPRRVAADIIGDLRVYNLKLADVYLLLPRISLPDEDTRRYEIEQFKTMLPVLRAIGTPGVTLSPGIAQPVRQEMPPAKPSKTARIPDNTETEEEAEAGARSAEQRVIDALTEMSDAAGDDLSISIEPHPDSMAHTPVQVLKLLEAVPGLALTLDWAQFIQQGFTVDDLVPLLPHTRHIHLRQAAKGRLQTPFESGTIDLPGVMRALSAADYRGVVCMEYLRTTQDLHGMSPVNIIRETVRLRDTLRAARKN